MLLRRRAPGIEDRAATTTSQEFEHLDRGWIAVIRWLNANGVDYVLVGPVAEAIRGRRDARGPVAIVPAPYRRNYDCLERALWAAHARQRLDHALDAEPDTVPIKVTADKLARGLRWTLRCGSHSLDIEPLRQADGEESDPPASPPGYQELLYEATRFTLTDDVSVEVASPEDIEHYAQRARTGVAPTVRIMRTAEVPQVAGPQAS
jgi:hypothetical protein